MSVGLINPTHSSQLTSAQLYSITLLNLEAPYGSLSGKILSRQERTCQEDFYLSYPHFPTTLFWLPLAPVSLAGQTSARLKAPAGFPANSASCLSCRPRASMPSGLPSLFASLSLASRSAQVARYRAKTGALKNWGYFRTFMPGVCTRPPPGLFYQFFPGQAGCLLRKGAFPEFTPKAHFAARKLDVKRLLSCRV
ncbi:hypothetical protein Desku_2861 [Desulfofundulus kuznetsovii DSM 6115]|uniref:Uncharacterized protein n=1 Tax=Desulfofundulus kuznetsovii (strain DSM 6115 / VKM B-1805 / 17) TaxID=760568 RepID=A0AAU8PJV7_DESK7|nr:hypothetical protein Desku_2861 [Desulfofundulus kuznetsovii DSM 6115]